MTGGSRNPVTEETYIRQLPYSVHKYLSSLLDLDKQWDRFVVLIPKRLQDVGKSNIEMRYTNHQVRLFENKDSPTKAILDDWATQNTKVKHLIRILQEAALYQAADYLSVNVLHGSKVPRLQNDQPDNNASLPVPEWSDQKLKTVDSSPPVSEKLFSENTDQCSGKDIHYHEKAVCRPSEHVKKDQYQNEKLLLNGNAGSHCSPYNRLVKSETNSAYSKISHGASVENCYRTPSFDSGGMSDVLKSPNQYLELSGGVEHEEATYQLRSFKEQTCLKQQDEDVYSYASSPCGYEMAKEPPKMGSVSPPLDETPNKNVTQQPRREPCETSDISDTGQETSDDMYKLLGRQKMSFGLLRMVTDDFNPESVVVGGRKIGSGGFGNVFLGILNNDFKIAVKKLKTSEEVDKQFETELKSLIKYRHKNIVRLYGYSIDGPEKCLVYEYLRNGSLEDRLNRKDNSPPLPVEVRVNILKGTAQGIYYLNSQRIVHRDIKSANVLLDDNFEPKVGDFATARIGPQGNNTMPMSTQVVIGTKAYLAPEAMFFDISTKLDSYSFGIIILEVLTGLPPLDESRQERDLKSHVDDYKISDILDTSGGKWEDVTVVKLSEISEKCTQHKKKLRVNVEDILSELMGL